MNRLRSISLMLALSGALYHAAIAAQLPAKHWVGTATSHGHAIPIHLDLSVSTTGEVTGDFVNGPQLTPSSNGQLTGTHLVLNFSYFARKLEGDFTGDSFKGTFGGSRGEPSTLELHPVLAAAGAPKPTPDAGIKQVRGDWEIAVKSPKGESAWTLRVTPLAGGDQIKAVILRIDGDTNGLYGAFDAEHGEYRVSHFNASGAGSLRPEAAARWHPACHQPPARRPAMDRAPSRGSPQRKPRSSHQGNGTDQRR
jgi:hypothetical protein